MFMEMWRANRQGKFSLIREIVDSPESRAQHVRARRPSVFVGEIHGRSSSLPSLNVPAAFAPVRGGSALSILGGVAHRGNAGLDTRKLSGSRVCAARPADDGLHRPR